MPRTQLSAQKTIVRMFSDNNIRGSSTEERPRQKILSHDEFDSLISPPAGNAHPILSQKRLCHRQMNNTPLTNDGNQVHGSDQSIGHRPAPFTDDCFVDGFNEGFQNVLMVAILLLLVNVAVTAVCLRLRLWGSVRRTRHDRLSLASSIDKPDPKTEV